MRYNIHTITSKATKNVISNIPKTIMMSRVNYYRDILYHYYYCPALVQTVSSGVAILLIQVIASFRTLFIDIRINVAIYPNSQPCLYLELLKNLESNDF